MEEVVGEFPIQECPLSHDLVMWPSLPVSTKMSVQLQKVCVLLIVYLFIKTISKNQFKKINLLVESYFNSFEHFENTPLEHIKFLLIF